MHTNLCHNAEVSLPYSFILNMLHTPPGGSSYGLYQNRLTDTQFQPLVGWGKLARKRERRGREGGGGRERKRREDGEREGII